MAKFRKKPVVIEAVQYNGGNWNEINSFMEGSLSIHPIHKSPMIHTLEGDHLVTKGDFVIKGVKGEFYPCKPDIFAATYEPVEEAAHV
jgi:hypothetical protein